MKNDYYSLLGIAKDATPDQIKKAYRKLALELHPDRNDSKRAEEKFKKISEAYAVLSDPDKRKDYDEGKLDIQRSMEERGAYDMWLMQTINALSRHMKGCRICRTGAGTCDAFDMLNSMRTVVETTKTNDYV